jgi:antitoxin HigA-1
MDNTPSPIHPGEVLLEDFSISQIVHGQRAISVDTAMRLARYFGTSAAVWLCMQVRYELEIAQDQLSDRINREVKVLQQPAHPVKSEV